jgi:hypothetical protein
MGKGIFRLIFLSTAVDKGTNLTVLAMEANQKREALRYDEAYPRENRRKARTNSEQN